VDRKSGEQIAETRARRTLRACTAAKDFVIGERQRGIGETDASRHAYVSSIHVGSAVLRVVERIVRSDKDLIQVAVAGATAVIHFDLAGDVAGRRSDTQLSRGIE